MKVVVCPHCAKRRIVADRVPKDVVVVVPCPSCQELVVLFREKVIGLNREVIEHGSFDERKAHIAEIIAQFLEPGLFPFGGLELPPPRTNESDDDLSDFEEEIELEDFRSDEITQSEVDRFVKIELQRIDDPVYFKKHFH